MKHFEEISEHGIFHGIANYQENKPLNIKDKKGLIYNRVGVAAGRRTRMALAQDVRFQTALSGRETIRNNKGKYRIRMIDRSGFHVTPSL